MILKYVLGDRMIHVKYLHRYELHELGFNKPSDPKAKGVLYRAVCRAKKSETEAYDEVRLSSGQVPADDDAEYYIASCKDRHSDCLMCKRGPMGDRNGRLTNQVLMSPSAYLEQAVDLSVIGTCRELYRECHEVFWKTNTFSFDDPKSFTEFMAGRILVEKRKIHRIHISMEVSIDQESGRNEDPFRSWRTRAIIPRLIKPFNNLRVLHLSIDQYSPYRHYNFDMKPRLSHNDSQRVVLNKIESVLALRLLPLKQVTVVISDDNTTKAGWIADRWTKSQKCELAEEFRGKLTDPHAAQTHEADMKAAKEEKQRAIETKALVYIRTLQFDLDRVQAEADAAKPSADMYRELEENHDTGSGLAAIGKNVGGRADQAEKRFKMLQDTANGLRERFKELQENPKLAQGQKVYNRNDNYRSG